MKGVSSNKEKAERGASASVDVPNNVSYELLNRARSGPTDNRAVVDAMLESCRARPNRIDRSSHNEASGESLVGSTVGGSSLQRSVSADESEVTMTDYIRPSCASKTTESIGGGPSNALHRHDPTNKYQKRQQSKKNRVYCIFHKAPYNILSSNTDVPSNQNFHPARDTIDPRIKSNNVPGQPTLGHIQPTSFHLPAGWKVHLSKTKKRPYYVHPDFGSTWHNPGLMLPSSVAIQKEFPSVQCLTSSMPQKNSQESVVHWGSRNEMHSAEASGSTNKKCIMSRFDDNNREDEYLLQEELSKHEGSSFYSSENCSDSQENKNASPKEIESRCLVQEHENEEGDLAAHDNVGEEIQQWEEGEDPNPVMTGNRVYDQYHDNDAVEFENKQMDDFDELADSKSGKVSDYDHSGIEEDESQDEINSLVSDHVDVDVLLRGTWKSSSPLPTIKELLHDSTGFGSSEIAPNDAGFNENHVDAHSTQISLQCKKQLYTNSSRESDKVDKSELEDVQSSPHDDDFFANYRCYQDQSPMVGRNDVASDDSEDDKKVSCAKSHRKNNIVTRKLDCQIGKEGRASSGRFTRKLFPPGPLCSLQCLDLIVDGAMNTPLWRNCKRKRSTLTSIKRNRARYETEKKCSPH